MTTRPKALSLPSALINNLAAAAIFLSVAAGSLETALGQTLSPTFITNYNLLVLGSVPNVPGPYGGLIFLAGDPNTLLIGGASASSGGQIYSVHVQRDPSNHVVGFGSATVFANAPYNDGGLAYDPNGSGVLLVALTTNAIGEIKSGSTSFDKVVALGALGVTNSPGGLNFVPTGFPGAGQLKLFGYADAEFYAATFGPDGAGTFNITAVASEAQLPVSYYYGSHPPGPEAFIYLPPGKPGFANYSTILVCETDGNPESDPGGAMVAYQLDANGAPVPSTRQVFITGGAPVEGAAVDPVTGDLLFSTFPYGYFGSDAVFVGRGGAAIPTRVLSLVGTLAFGNVTVGTTAQSTLTINNSGNATLTVSDISYPSGFSGNWPSGTIPAGGSQNVTVTFAPTAATTYDANITVSSDATSGSSNIAVSGTGVSPDTQGPALTITSPADGATVSSPSLIVSGTASDSGLGNDGIASVTVNGVSATGGSATGDNTANWSATITLSPGQDTITVVAKDTLNNSTTRQFTVTLLQPPALTLSPSAITNNYTGIVQLQVTGLTPGQTVQVEMFMDISNTGAIEPGDPLYPSFSITDGQTPVMGGVTNANIPFDNDGTANGEIIVTLPLHGDFGMDKTTGNYLCRVSDPTGRFAPLVTSFRIQPVVYPQGIVGTLNDTTTAAPVQGAVVGLLDLSGVMDSSGGFDSFQMRLVGSAFTDSQGRYTAYAPPGNYLPLALRVGYSTALPVNNLISLLSMLAVVQTNQWTPHAAAVTPGTLSISGRLTESQSDRGLPGIVLFALGQATAGNLDVTFGYTDANGNFQLPVGPGLWNLMLPPLALARLGCVAVTNLPPIDTTTGSVSGVSLVVPAATHLIYGRLASANGTPLAGVRVDAVSTTSTNYYTAAFTDTNGQYVLGVFAGDWQLRPDVQTVDTMGYEQHTASVTVSNTPTVLTNLTFQPIPSPDPGTLSWYWQNPLPQGNHLEGVAAGNGVFVAVGDHGTILRSTDGRQWSIEDSGTAVMLHAVTFANGRFVAVGGENDANGDYGVAVVSTNGVSWESVTVGSGSGQLQAITFGQNLYVAVGDGGIASSPDGVNWMTRKTGGYDGSWLRVVAFGNGQFVAGGDDFVLLTSPDGVNWSDTLTNNGSMASLVFGNGTFVAGVQGASLDLTSITSTNGLNWTMNSGATVPLAMLSHLGLFYGVGVYGVSSGGVSAGAKGGVATSPNGLNWTTQPLPAPVNSFALSAIAADNGAFVAVGDAGAIAYSQDGINWLAASSGWLLPLNDVFFCDWNFLEFYMISTVGSAWRTKSSVGGRLLYAGGMFFAGGSASMDGEHWWGDDALGAVSPNELVYVNGTILAVGTHGLFSSSDGLHWQALAPGLTNSLLAIANGNGLLVAADDATIWVSDDAAHWSATFNIGSMGLSDLRDLAFANGRFVAVGGIDQNSWALASPDGTNWNQAIVPPTGQITRLATGAGNFVAVGDNLSVSADGLHWKVVQANVPAIYGVAYGNQHFVAVGDNGAILRSAAVQDDSPAILTQPQSHTLAPGMSLILSVSAQSSLPVSYQWFKDGQPIPGANSSTLQITGVQTQDAGQYTVQISNGHAAVVSDPAWVRAAAVAPSTSPFDQWQPVSPSPFGTTSLYSIAYGWSSSSEAIVAVGDSGAIFTSLNDGPWAAQYSGTTNALIGVAFGEQIYYGFSLPQFVAVGGTGTILASSDGSFWEQDNSSTTNSLERVAFGDGLFVAVGDLGTLLTSTNGINWNMQNSGTTQYLLGVVVGVVNTNLLIVAVGTGATLISSTHGSAWISHALGLTNDLLGATFCNGQFVVVATGGLILTSRDGLVWQRQEAPVQSDLWSVAFAEGFFVAVGDEGAIVSSPDGVHWTQRALTTSASLYGVTFANGAFRTVGDAGTVLYSRPMVQLRWSSFSDGVLALQGPAGHFYRIEAADQLQMTNDWTWQAEFYVPSNSPPESPVFLPSLSGASQRFFRAVLVP